MSKKLYILISTLIGLAVAASEALVTYFEPAHAAAINGTVSAIGTCAVTICGLWTANTVQKKLEK